MHSEAVSTFFYCKTVGLDYFEAFSLFSICVDVSPQKWEILPHQVVILKYLFEAVAIIFPVKNCFFLYGIRDTYV